MGNDRLCDCGSVADWEEVGSTWMCMACRDRDVRKNIAAFKDALARMQRIEGDLRLFKVSTTSIPESLSKLRDEIRGIEANEKE